MREIWHRWQATSDRRHRDKLVTMFAGMVRYLVLQKAQQLPPRCEIDDLVSCGMIALMETIDRWDPARGVPLEQVAWTRVHGAILDELRRQDWAPRSVRRNERAIARAEERLTAVSGRRPAAPELAAATNMTTSELEAARAGVHRAVVGSLNAPARRTEDEGDQRIDLLCGDDESRPDMAAERNDAKLLVRAAVAALPLRERQVAALLYDQGLSQREASHVLGLTESRVSQIHTRLRNALRMALASQHEAFELVG